MITVTRTPIGQVEIDFGMRQRATVSESDAIDILHGLNSVLAPPVTSPTTESYAPPTEPKEVETPVKKGKNAKHQD